MGIPPEELGSWEDPGRRRVRKSGQGDSLPSQRPGRIHHSGREDAERYLSRCHICGVAVTLLPRDPLCRAPIAVLW